MVAEKQVSRGAALLDEKHPGWHWNIDLDRLNISEPCDCICGQLYGSFYLGLRKLDIDHPTARYGFVGYYLEPIWKKEIEARRDADVRRYTDEDLEMFAKEDEVAVA